MGRPFEELEKLYIENKDMVYRVCLRFSYGDSEWASDRMQEVFLKLADKWHDLPDINHPKSFIYRTTFNLCVNNIKRKKNLLKLFAKFFNSDVIDSVSGEDYIPPDKSAEDNEMLKQLDKALSVLDEKQRMAVIMYYFEDVEIPEIARILGINKGTVSRRLKSAREKLARELGKDLD
ncbi:MAG: sigma-70 family RNA polymerase sigma factor [Deltaproteobacteria bacterium]|nr:sigma-70 family RNA polymerase sigma factor [Deltaproteobacteria bacterium]